MVQLQDYIESLQSDSLSLKGKIQAMVDLISKLEVEVPTEYGYFVKHPDYEGTGDLTEFGLFWLDCGHRCHTEDESLQVRLLHQSMDNAMYEIYNASHDLLMNACADGKITAPEDDGCSNCPACNPDLKFVEGFHRYLALTFDQETYKSFWGNEESQNPIVGLDREVDETDEEWREQLAKIPRVATREQVLRAFIKSETRAEDTNSCSTT